LPTKEEWEKAAKATSTNNYPWGNSITGQYANYENSGDSHEPGTTPVGYFSGEPHNGFPTADAKSPYGVYDLSGNVWEWIYSSSTSMGHMGGSYNSASFELKIWNYQYYLNYNYLVSSFSDVGFRPVKKIH
jgi:formylglycine-generating enzyme required for sulfatase activity